MGGAADGDGLGAAVVGAAVRICKVGLGAIDTLALGDGDGHADVPAKRDRPPPRSNADEKENEETAGDGRQDEVDPARPATGVE